MKTVVRRTLIAAVLLTLGCDAGFSQENVVLTRRAQPGQSYQRKSTSTVQLDSGGKPIRLEVLRTEKVTITKVSPSGDITMEIDSQGREISSNGLKTTVDVSKDGKRTVTIRPDGTLVSYKLAAPEKPAAAASPSNGQTPAAKSPDGKKPSAMANPTRPAKDAKSGSEASTPEKDEKAEQAEKDKKAEEAEKAERVKTEARLYPVSEPLFPKDAVSVGSRWSHDYAADPETGTRAAHADFEVLGFEKIGDTETVRLRMVYRETGAAPALSAVSTLWIDRALGSLVVADADVENLPSPMGAPTTLVAANVRTERADGKKDKRIAEIVKDFDRLPGVITLYRKQEDGKDTIYAELRADQLDSLMMLEATASTGTSANIVAGDPINDIVFRFTRTGDDRIVIATPNTSFRASEDTPIARAVRRSFADAYLESFKIEAEDKAANTVLINISDLFKTDIARVSEYFSGRAGGFALDREKTYVTRLSNYPENLVVEAQYHFTKGGSASSLEAMLSASTLADPRSAPVRISYNLFPLPEDGYKPRLADGRIGYFTTDHQTFDHDDLHDPMVRYILRWDLEKADPKAAMSPPKKPIVFWLDNAIPVQYRGAVRDGILFWNRAFEGIGIKDAIEVRQMPDDADWDHADMRYNTIRWVASPDSGYAVALFRTNPLTGQILNANITVDANLVRALKLERRDVLAPSVAFDAGAGSDVPALAAQPGTQPAERPGRSHAFDPRYCNMATGMVEQAWFGHLALSMVGSEGLGGLLDEEAYINGYLRQVVSHEMGHIVGLRHNFIASTQFSLDELTDAERVRGHGVTASVMDYTPFNIAALRLKDVDYYSQTVGDYDKWAIRYGYMPVPDAATPQAERPILDRVARESGRPGHAYQSDEIADQFDPLVTRFDLGSDPLAYYGRMLRVSRYLLVHLDERLPKKGESYWEFTRAFNRLLGSYAGAAGRASRFIGGLNVNRNFKGDAGEKPTLVPVSAAKQREALDLLNTYVFSPTAFAFPERYFTKLAPNPHMDWREFLMGASQDFPVFDDISGIQRSALARLFQPAVLRRIANNEFKQGGDPDKAFTMPYLFRSVNATVWSELGQKANVPPLRRQMQRAHLDTMIAMAVSPPYGVPEDARMLAWENLRTLKGRLATAQRGAGYDDYTRIHLDDSLARVTRALEPQLVVGQASTR